MNATLLEDLGPLEIDRADLFDQSLFFIGLIKSIPCNLFKISISEHAESVRVLPADTPRPGPLDLSYTPYLIEPMNNMSPNSSIQETVIMKGAQLGFTMMAESVICFYIGEDPSSQLFLSASKDSIEKWAAQRLEPAINSYGYRDIIQSNHNRSGKRTGDKMFSKEYFGRRLDMGSAQSAAGMRSTEKRILIRDEIDGAPAKLKTGEGNWLDVSFARTNAWGDRKKILDFSTPTTYEKSLMWKRYQEGDRRHYHVPCPHCKKKQVLLMENLIDVREDGLIIDAFYACKHCGEAIFEYHKPMMFKKELCEWIPTAIPIHKYIRSYWIPTLYSPLGMMSFVELARKRDKANNSIDPEDQKTFVNLYQGMPFKEIGQKPRIDKVLELKGVYQANEVPDMVLFITIGIDVQRGSEKDKLNPARLELEILGHGPGYRTFSIDYKKIIGPVDDAFSGAWEDLHEWAIETNLEFSKKDGTKIETALTFIDSGDGTLTNIVYSFCERWGATFPIKGYQSLSKEKGLDRVSATDYKRYKRSKVNEETTLYIISTNYYKNTIYNNLKISRIDQEIQKPGFSDFPISYDRKYFEMLTAEEKRQDGNFYCPEKKRNEALDCRAYALCAADVYLDMLTEKYREAAKNKGVTETDLKKINRRWIISMLKDRFNVTD